MREGGRRVCLRCGYHSARRVPGAKFHPCPRDSYPSLNITPLILKARTILGTIFTSSGSLGIPTIRRHSSRSSVDEAEICILKEVFCYNGSFLRSPVTGLGAVWALGAGRDGQTIKLIFSQNDNVCKWRTIRNCPMNRQVPFLLQRWSNGAFKKGYPMKRHALIKDAEVNWNPPHLPVFQESNACDQQVRSDTARSHHWRHCGRGRAEEERPAQVGGQTDRPRRIRRRLGC